MSNVMSEIHKPEDCLLLLALPLTKDIFLKDLERDSRKDYAKSTAKRYKLLPWALYQYHHLPLINILTSVAKAVSGNGVTVRLSTTLEDLQDLSGFKVVTLVAHYDDEKSLVEFSDSLYTADEVGLHFDQRFSGILDLSVCNSTILQDKLKDIFGDRFFIKANREKAEIKAHLIFYKKVIELLGKSETNYLTETFELRKKLNQYIKSKV
jgi:hypothetical protein